MSRIQKVLQELRSQNKKAFVAYITAGDPSLEATVAAVEALVKSGVDIIELGVPFSDPIADGPSNQRAAHRALQGQTNLSDIFSAVDSIRKKNQHVPILLFTYLNPLLSMGLIRVKELAEKVGLDGILVVDLPPGEHSEYHQVMDDSSLDTVFLASPMTDQKRLTLIDQHSSGFVYYVSRTGVTGVQSEISNSLTSEIANLRKFIKKPLLVGFGISNPDQARSIAALADGVVIGSALVNIIEEATDQKSMVKNLSLFASSIRQAIDKFK